MTWHALLMGGMLNVWCDSDPIRGPDSHICLPFHQHVKQSTGLEVVNGRDWSPLLAVGKRWGHACA